jgi:hypothetical protein
MALGQRIEDITVDADVVSEGDDLPIRLEHWSHNAFRSWGCGEISETFYGSRTSLGRGCVTTSEAELDMEKEEFRSEEITCRTKKCVWLFPFYPESKAALRCLRPWPSSYIVHS